MFDKLVFEQYYIGRLALSAFKLTELMCSGSIPVQVAGLVLLTALAVGLYLRGTVMSLNLNNGGNMKSNTKKHQKRNRLLTGSSRLKLVSMSVIMTAHAILTSFLGGTPMLA
jgi:hypothetical protein